MDIYTFDEKTMEQRLQDYSEIFKSNDSCRDFKIFLESNKRSMELCNVIRKIPKYPYEIPGLKINRPTEVFGVLTFVRHWNFKGNFKVFGAKSWEDKVLVELEDIYPTKRQDNKSRHINAYLAADIIDRLRFLKQHILMPWDHMNDWSYHWKPSEDLKPRLKLFYDLKNGKINKSLSSHIRHLIDHAARIKVEKDKLDEYVNGPGEDEDDEPPSEAFIEWISFDRRFMPIMTEFNFFVSPTVQKIYPDLGNSLANLKLEKQTFAVSENSEFLNDLKKEIPDTASVQLLGSLDEVFLKTTKNVEIYLSIGQHTMTSPEFLCDFMISGSKAFTLTDHPDDDLSSVYSIVSYSKDYKKCFLLNIVGNAILKNLVIDRGNTASGILIAAGNVKIENCLIKAKTTYYKGLTILGGATVILENCVVQGFYLGIVLEKGAKLTLKNSTIKNCMDGLEILGKCEVTFENSSIMDSKEHAIIQYVKKAGINENVIVKDLMAEPEKIDIQFVGDCKFERNQDGDAVIIPVSKDKASEADVFFESDDEN